MILRQLIQNDDYYSRVIAFIDKDYFSDINCKRIFKYINDYGERYKKTATERVLQLCIDSDSSLNEQNAKDMESTLLDLQLHTPDKQDMQWLTDETEKWARQAAIYNAITRSIGIIDGSDKRETMDQNGIPELLQDALAVSLDTNIGHDFLDDAEERYNFYHTKESKLAFDLEMMNKITDGGITKKTLSILMAGTGGGKTLTKTHFASDWLSQGKNVLYITLEMAEERIAQRIDANLLNTAVSDVEKLPKDLYEDKIAKLKEKTQGKLIVKEYATASAHVGHFRFLLKELRMKKKFVPDVIFVDYLNLMLSSRIKPTDNMYQYVKFIAEELRGLAVEFNVPIVSSTQLNRSGFTDSDPGLENTSESFGLPATADLMLCLITTEKLAELGQIMVKQLKNRYRDENMDRKFILGIDKPKMRLYDVQNNAQTLIVPDNPTIEKKEKSKFANFNMG